MNTSEAILHLNIRRSDKKYEKGEVVDVFTPPREDYL